MARIYSMQVASNCQGSSPSFHQASGARGFRTDSRIAGRCSSTHRLRSSNEIYLERHENSDFVVSVQIGDLDLQPEQAPFAERFSASEGEQSSAEIVSQMV